MEFKKTLKRIAEYDKERYLKGFKYFRDGRIKNALNYKGFLIAEVIGNDVYRVKISDNKKEIKCTCPDGAEYCKHVIAVMLAYNRNKNLFVDFDKIIEDLEQKDKKELLRLIEQMYVNKIDLMDLLKLKQIEIDKIEDFSKDLYGTDTLFKNFIRYNEMQALIKKLDVFFSTALNYKESRDYKKAFIILWSLIRTIDNNIDSCDDSNGEVGDFFYECIDAISDLINLVVVEKELKEKLFKEMFNLWNYNDFGIEEAFLSLIEESANKDDSEFIINEINNIINGRKDKYFLEYRKEELDELKSNLENLKNGNNKKREKTSKS